jgi:hypothetical protein
MTAPNPDGALIPAKQLLEDALHALCGPQSRLVNGKLLVVPSRYMQIRDAADGEQSNAGGGAGGKSRPPGWTDAFDIRNEIDQAAAIWCPQLCGVPPTVGRLRFLVEQTGWRPQDCHKMKQITDAMLEWAAAIDALLEPEPVVYLMAAHPDSGPAACTNCGAKRVYRKDSAGELVRQPALKVTKDGCRCQFCRASWEPGQLRMLAAALGYPLPDGVLE